MPWDTHFGLLWIFFSSLLWIDCLIGLFIFIVHAYKGRNKNNHTVTGMFPSYFCESNWVELWMKMVCFKCMYFFFWMLLKFCAEKQITCNWKTIDSSKCNRNRTSFFNKETLHTPNKNNKCKFCFHSHFQWTKLCSQKAYSSQIFKNYCASGYQQLKAHIKSVSGVTTICVMYCNTSPLHRFDQVDWIKCKEEWAKVPLLFKSCGRLLDIKNSMFQFLPLQSIPNMLIGQHVRWYASRNCVQILATWDCALSCCNMRWWPSNNGTGSRHPISVH